MEVRTAEEKFGRKGLKTGWKTGRKEEGRTAGWRAERKEGKANQYRQHKTIEAAMIVIQVPRPFFANKKLASRGSQHTRLHPGRCVYTI